MRRVLSYLFYATLTLGVLGGLSACAPLDPLPKKQAKRGLPTPPLSVEEVKNAPAQLPVSENTNTVKVALLLPLSGDTAPIGKAMVDAATLALYDYYLGMDPTTIRARIELVPVDTGNSPTTARTAAQQALDGGAQLLIGPLFSPAVTASAPLAKTRGVPMIALSNNRSVAGENVYVFGFLPEQQVARLADYAFSQGITSVAGFVPNDAYGDAVGEVLKARITVKGGSVAPFENYVRTPTDLLATSARRFALGMKKSRARPQALFMAESPERVDAINQAITKEGASISGLKLLGTGLWDDPAASANPLLNGAWVASAPPARTANFSRRFKAVYKYESPRLASLAYDAATIAADLVQEKGTANFGRAAMTNPVGFMTPANGLVRFMPDGTSERGLAILELSSEGTKQRDPAPMKF